MAGSCVWIALIKALKLGRTTTPAQLLAYVKAHNRLTPDITWNGEALSKQQMKENREAIKVLNTSCLKLGYDCSTADPLLFLVAQLYNTSIEHRYLTCRIRYINRRFPAKWLKFRSNQGHFW